MRNYGVIDGMIRVNKSRARAMYNAGYEVMLAMGGETDYLHKTWHFMANNIYEGDFDHNVLDFYNNTKSSEVGYIVEYWVNLNDSEEYVKEYNKERQRKHKAKMNR